MSAEFKEEFIPCQEENSQITSGIIPSTSSSNCYSESLQSCSVSFDRLSWHEHVYRRLTNKPTPHYIENILGLQNRSAGGQLQQDGVMIGHVTPPVSPKNSFSNVQQPTVPSDVNEPLNLSVKNELKVRTKTVKEPTRKRKKGREPLDLKVAAPAIQVLEQNVEPPEAVSEDAESKNKKKKARTTFTGRQIFELEKQFELKKYLSSSERSEMAKLLNVTETQVKESSPLI
ncbi:hypothetical protein NQ315_010187 [Exocentrus adspersus]|uniref:Homeobox domain-containing protein n=1 Tax=Exocentrus adspersus TaxID=1586481 RepID=A0AAV8WAM4_9CUCU|nr:hypothetical protein NQ315_010187 [Exocentrus adspersus]